MTWPTLSKSIERLTWKGRLTLLGKRLGEVSAVLFLSVLSGLTVTFPKYRSKKMIHRHRLSVMRNPSGKPSKGCGQYTGRQVWKSWSYDLPSYMGLTLQGILQFCRSGLKKVILFR